MHGEYKGSLVAASGVRSKEDVMTSGELTGLPGTLLDTLSGRIGCYTLKSKKKENAVLQLYFPLHPSDVWLPLPPWQVLRKERRKDNPSGWEDGAPGKSPEDAPVEADDPGGRLLLCKRCHHKITKSGARNQVHGAHRHVFCNPNGHVFEIGCFSMAPGCAHEGPPIPEFSWFAGFAWQVALCGGCREHLGWRYVHQSGESVFHGLILQHLVEDSD